MFRLICIMWCERSRRWWAHDKCTLLLLRKKLYTNAWEKKEEKEEERTDHKFLWHRKKDQTTNVDGKRKMATLIRQANSWHQMKPTKQLKPPQKRKWWPTCKHKVEKNTTKSQQSNRLLSATNEWTTTLTTLVAAIRAQSKNNCADKQMESQTNHN